MAQDIIPSSQKTQTQNAITEAKPRGKSAKKRAREEENGHVVEGLTEEEAQMLKLLQVRLSFFVGLKC